MAVELKKTKGKQKIEMKGIENKKNALITFSKRKSGIYKKANELVILTGVQVAFVVFSPSGTPFSFAHPSIKIVTNRFLGQESSSKDATHRLIEAHRQHRIDKLNLQHNELNKILEEEKEKGNQLKKKMINTRPKGWWDIPIEKLSLEDMIKMEEKYKKLQEKLQAKIREKENDVFSSSQLAHSTTFSDLFSHLDEDSVIHSLTPRNQIDTKKN